MTALSRFLASTACDLCLQALSSPCTGLARSPQLNYVAGWTYLKPIFIDLTVSVYISFVILFW